MRKSYLVVIVIVAIALVGAGVWYFTQKNNDDTSSKVATNSTETSENSAGTNDSTLAGTDNASASNDTVTDQISIVNMAFTPSNITVKKGTKVTWTNNDSMEHNVTENDGKTGPKSGTLAKGDTYSFTYDTVGTFNYVCTFHSGMSGTVTVTE